MEHPYSLFNMGKNLQKLNDRQVQLKFLTLNMPEVCRQLSMKFLTIVETSNELIFY